MRNQNGKLNAYSGQGDISFVFASALAAIMILLTLAMDVTVSNELSDLRRNIILLVGGSGCIYIAAQTGFIIPKLQKRHFFYTWINAIISGVGLGVLAVAINHNQIILWGILQILATTSLALVFGRWPTYLMIAISAAFNIFGHSDFLFFSSRILSVASLLFPALASVVVTETLLHLRRVSQIHIDRLELVNRFSQQINSSIDKDQVIAILNAAFEGALVADTYYVGLVEDNQVHLNLFYDDGEYFTNVYLPLEGTFAGWVVNNQQPLLISDLRKGIVLKEMKFKFIIVGKEKASLSWMGVPMHTHQINGLLAVASYKPNSFNHSDLELLSNLAQHAALALDNTVHHAQVEKQSKLDSLTGTYNHGTFLKMLEESIEYAQLTKQALSLIMLDIDFFKQYNDSFGHQVGDMVLVELCNAIRQHIKSADFVGRWGGEEFVIALPNANGINANLVAARIQETMSQLQLNTLAEKTVPVPTVSQGVSVFPDESNDINKLIYLADQRLYIAKERGRNQIEPDPSHWDHILSTKK